MSSKPKNRKQCHHSRISATKTDKIMEGHGIASATSGQKNECFHNKDKFDLDIDGIIEVRKSYSRNPIIGYLNINTLQNKIVGLREMILKAPLDVFCIDETKLDDSFPNAQFLIEDYQFPPFRRDRNSKGGGKLVYVKQGIIAKRLEHLETEICETICIELTISKKKWCILFAYRPPKQNKVLFFEELSKCLSRIVNKYDNYFVAGDLNINMLDPKCDGNNYFSDLNDTYNLTNLVKLPTCFKSSKGTLIDVLLTNKPKSFQKTFVCETGLSDHHKLVGTILRSTFVKLPPKIIKYRSYKNFDKNKFCHELDQILLRGNLFKVNDPYDKLTDILSSTLEKHAPLKSKVIRGNQAPFMNKDLSKAIMEKSRLRNRHLKYPSRENLLAYKKIKNKCNNLLKQSKRKYLKEISREGTTTSKAFWNTVKPFMTNKGIQTNDNITIEVEKDEKIEVKGLSEKVKLKTNDLIKDETILVEMFNKHYINIVEKTSGIAPKNLGNPLDQKTDDKTIREIIENYQNHPSIIKIKQSVKENNKVFNFPEASTEEINKIIKSLNPHKATGPDGIPLKIIKTAANVIDCHLAYIINKDLKENKFSENAKTAMVRPIYKKDDRDKIKNYRPVSLLNGFSKIYERFLHNSLSDFTENILSKFVSAYRKSYSSNHVLLKLIEEWKKSLDEKNIVGAVLMDLSKAFDCIPHDLLVAKLHAYGLSVDAITFLYSYLKRRKQGVKINDTESLFRILLSGVPQGSILGPILFNIFVNDLIMFINEAKIANFADDNTIYAAREDLKDLINLLEKESEVAIKWFDDNNMVVNPEKFQAIIVGKKNKSNDCYNLTIKDAKVIPKKSVNLLGIEIDDKLSFEKHVSTIFKKANNRLNAISRIGSALGQKEKEILINTFVYSNFNYAPLVWHFTTRKCTNKIEKIQERSLKFILNDYNKTYTQLLEISKNPTMEVKRLRVMVIEIFKTLNEINPIFMKDILNYNLNRSHRKHNLQVHSRNTTRYGNNSLRILGAHIWNSLPENIKSSDSVYKLKDFIKGWYGCNCYLCAG